MPLFVSSQLIACGICFSAGIYSLLAGSAGQREPMTQAFGCLCLLLASYLLLTASTSQTDSLALARSLARWKVASACLINCASGDAGWVWRAWFSACCLASTCSRLSA
jgi:hypothetical protein